MRAICRLAFRKQPTLSAYPRAAVWSEQRLFHTLNAHRQRDESNKEACDFICVVPSDSFVFVENQIWLKICWFNPNIRNRTICFCRTVRSIRNRLPFQYFANSLTPDTPHFMMLPLFARGESVVETIRNAIWATRGAIVVISPPFLKSKWCIAELVMLIKRAKTVHTDASPFHFVPLFYKLAPSDVRILAPFLTAEEHEFFYDKIGIVCESEPSKTEIKSWIGDLKHIKALGMVEVVSTLQLC